MGKIKKKIQHLQALRRQLRLGQPELLDLLLEELNGWQDCRTGKSDSGSMCDSLVPE